MGAAPAEDVDVELVGLGQEQVGLGGHEREALDEADAQGAVRDHLRQGQRRRLHVEPALDDLEVRRDRPQVLVRVLVRQVAQAQRLPDLARRQELLELYSEEEKKSVRIKSGADGAEEGWGGGFAPFAVCRGRGRGCEGPRSRGLGRPLIMN